jgi:ActR/RegA family two-component response regulator
MMANAVPVSLTVLMVDDDERYADALFRDGQRQGVDVRHAASLEEAQGILKEIGKETLAGVILDVECYRRRDEQIPDGSFIIAATKYFTETAPELPLVALTGVQSLFERYRKDFAGIWRVFKKGRDEADMLRYLKERASELQWVQIMNDFRDVFRVVDTYLGDSARRELLAVLQSLDSTDLHVIRGTLATCRSLQEQIYLALGRCRPDMVPRQFLYYREQGREVKSINVGQILEHLKGNFDFRSQQVRGEVYLHYRSTLYRFSELIYRVASDAIHAIDDAQAVKPTRYTVRAVTAALLDLILWLEKSAGDGATALCAENVTPSLSNGDMALV